jgi:predicted enzyme related to lactoylglutathione lyase
VASPSGATFSLFREGDGDAGDQGQGEGSVHWTELHSTDLDADLDWLRKSFDYSTETMEMPNGPYTILKVGDEMAGGVMKQEHEGAPSMWLTWIKLAEVDAAIERADANGGKVLAPAFDVPNIGRMGILADPSGGVFGVITPAEA